MDEKRNKTNSDKDNEPPKIPPRTSSASQDCPSRNTLNPLAHTDIASSPISSFMFSGMAASPPQFVSLEQIMSAAKSVSNMVLCHEIAVNQDFKLHKAEPEEGRLEHRVKNIVHKAFWDLLSEQLDDDPPRYNQAMVLLTDVKNGLLSFLMPQHTRLSAQIEEVLDIDLIRQQAEHGALDVQRYATFILSVMSRLCAPIRDQKIRELSEITDIVPLFQGILELMDIMHLDMANFTLQQFRPTIQQHSIEYERTKFQEFLKSQEEMFPQVDGLECTRKWLHRNFTSLTPSNEDSTSSSSETKISMNNVLTKAYLELLEWDQSQPFPETAVIDQSRFVELGSKILLSVLTGSVLLVTLSLAGPDLQSLASFKEHLRKRIHLILQDHVDQLHNDAVLEEQLKNVSEQVEKEVQDCLEERGFTPMSLQNATSLKEQVVAVASPKHRVRSLVRSRVLSFLEEVISSSTASPIRVPPGLSSLQEPLTTIAGQFLRLVGHNRAVFQDYYNEIVDSFHSREHSD